MNWLDVSIETSTEEIDTVCAKIIALGIEGMQIEDFDDFTDFLENNKQYWDYVDDDLYESKKGPTRVKVYLSDNPSGRETLALLRTVMEGRKIDVSQIHSEDWETSWKQYYKPTPIGDKLLIVPEWEDIPTTDRAVFLNNPGMSFGTGTHASTRLALEALEKYISVDDILLDLGCGSGILSICGLLMGATYADAVDIDPNAAEVTVKNAELNGIGPDRCNAIAGDVLSNSLLLKELGDRQYNIVLANIIADVIVLLPGVVKEALPGGGLFISSGIIEPRLEDVLSTLESSGFNIIEVNTSDGWAAVVASI